MIEQLVNVVENTDQRIRNCKTNSGPTNSDEIRLVFRKTDVISTCLKHHRLVAAFFLLQLMGCVSVNISQPKSSKASNIVAESPSQPFAVLETPYADRAWRSTKTGNTIAYLSECNPKTDVPLRTLERESSQILSDARIISRDDKVFDGREASESFVEGNIDGIKVKMKNFIFKKESCSFTLSYMGRAEDFASETQSFETFKKGFSVP